MATGSEPQSIQIKAKSYFAKDSTARTREERKELLGVLGVEHPGHFLASVWSPVWEEAVDQVLDPRSSALRPLKPNDFHFKWGVGAINLLSRQTRLSILNLKLKPTGLETAIRALLAKGGYSDKDFVVEDVEILRFIHAEYSIHVRTADSRRVRVEVSHYLPAAEEIFHHFAEPFGVPVTTLYVGKTPHGKKFVLELEEPGRVEFSEAPADRLSSFAERILARAGLHDALGDVLGTIMRDPHYLLSADGELYSFHHYQLFLEMGEDQFGFFRPVFSLLGEELGREREWYEKYRDAYVREFLTIRRRAAEIFGILDGARDVVDEYIGGPGEFGMVRAGIEQRLQIDPAGRAEAVGKLFCESPLRPGTEG